jgi:hypothetical protein
VAVDVVFKLIRVAVQRNLKRSLMVERVLSSSVTVIMLFNSVTALVKRAILTMKSNMA